MRLFIPDIGTEILLLSDWVFPLCFEYRNADLMDAFSVPKLYSGASWKWGWHSWDGVKTISVTLPKGTILRVDRIYIRKNSTSFDPPSAAFSSITFYAKIPGVKKKARFWAWLKDVNRIECDVISAPLYQHGSSSDSSE